MSNRLVRRVALATIAASVGFVALPAVAQDRLTNVSYDPTRELYAQYAELFTNYWRETTGRTVTITNTHGGSGAQVNAVLDGLPADVVTLPLGGDILALQNAGLIDEGWQAEFPENSAPYTSTIVFLVRAGNPENIQDWDDLVRPGVGVITPSPKTSGGARWNFLAAWAYELDRSGGDENAALAFVRALYANVTVLDSGARGSTNTFVQNGVGDVLIAWENEAYLTLEQLGEGRFEIVVPSLSIVAEPPVAIVDRTVDANGNRDVATAFLEQLYSPAAQALIAANHYRPIHPEYAAPEDVALFPEIELVTIDDLFGGWASAQATFFNDGGVFDQIYSPF